MNFTKIQPEQLQMPTFFSNSGDFLLADLTTGFRIDLNRSLSGDFDFNGTVNVYGKRLISVNNSNTYESDSGSQLIGGNNNIIFDDNSFVFFGDDNVVYDENNVILHGYNNTMETGTYRNTLVCGNTITFASGTTGSCYIGGQSSNFNVENSQQLIINFASGQKIIGETFLEDDIHLTGNIYQDGNFYSLGDFGITGDIQQVGSIFFTGNSYRVGNQHSTGNFYNTGTLKLGGNLNVLSSATVHKSLSILEGLSVAKSAGIGESLTVSKGLTVGRDADINLTLHVRSQATIDSGLAVGENITMSTGKQVIHQDLLTGTAGSSSTIRIDNTTNGSGILTFSVGDKLVKVTGFYV